MVRGRVRIDGRARAAVLTLWLVLAGAVTGAAMSGLSRVVVVGLLALVAVSGGYARRWSVAVGAGLAAGVVAGGLALTDGRAAAAAPLVVTFSLTGLLAGAWRFARLGDRTSTSLADGPATPAAPGCRLPAGVADQLLFERLTVHEMTRARRYDRPLTLLLVGVENWTALVAQRGRRAAGELQAALATCVRRLLRDVDAIGVHGEGRLAVLLPETPLDGGLIVAARIEQAALGDVGVKVRVGAAVFPHDAVTVEALLREAEAALELAQLEKVSVVERAQLG